MYHYFLYFPKIFFLREVEFVLLSFIFLFSEYHQYTPLPLESQRKDHFLPPLPHTSTANQPQRSKLYGKYCFFYLGKREKEIDLTQKEQVKTKTKYPMSSNSHPSVVANKCKTLPEMRGGGLQNKREHHTIFKIHESVHPTAATKTLQNVRLYNA